LKIKLTGLGLFRFSFRLGRTQITNSVWLVIRFLWIGLEYPNFGPQNSKVHYRGIPG
jgi:hypothetical protein